MEIATGEFFIQQLICIVLMYKVFWWALWPLDDEDIYDNDGSDYELTTHDKQLKAFGWFQMFFGSLILTSAIYIFLVAANMAPKSGAGSIFLSVFTTGLVAYVVVKRLSRKAFFSKNNSNK